VIVLVDRQVAGAVDDVTTCRAQRWTRPCSARREQHVDRAADVRLESSRGFFVDTTMLRAAAWNTTCASADQLLDTVASQTNPARTRALRRRFSRRPVNRSSRTVTRAPSRSRRRTSCCRRSRRRR